MVILCSTKPRNPSLGENGIFSALTYFISPIDTTPDAIPFVGFVDDLGVIAATIGTVSLYITEEVKRQANQKMKDWLGKQI